VFCALHDQLASLDRHAQLKLSCWASCWYLGHTKIQILIDDDDDDADVTDNFISLFVAQNYIIMQQTIVSDTTVGF